MKQLTIQSLRFLIGFQEDIKIMIKMIIVIIIIVIIIVILACPDARCESGQTSGSCRTISIKCDVIHYITNINMYINIYIYNHGTQIISCY